MYEYDCKVNQDKTRSAPTNKKSCPFPLFPYLSSASWMEQFKILKFLNMKIGAGNLKTIDTSQLWPINLLHHVTFWMLSDAAVKPHPKKAHVGWTINALAMQVVWNALPDVGTVWEQNAWTLVGLDCVKWWWCTWGISMWQWKYVPMDFWIMMIVHFQNFSINIPISTC